MELDSFLAIRRWFHDAEQTPKVLLPAPDADAASKETVKAQLNAEAFRILSTRPLHEEGPAGQSRR